MKYSNYGLTADAIPTAVDQWTPSAGTKTQTTVLAEMVDTWTESKYIIYRRADPGGSPYLDPAAVEPYFRLTDMTYDDGAAGPPPPNIRNSCPMTYTLEGPDAAKFSFNVDPATTSGYNGNYDLVLSTDYETPGTYEVVVKGQAHKSSNDFKIKFVLIIADFCTFQGLTNSVTLDPDRTSYPSFKDYQHYDASLVLQPADVYTVPLANFVNGNTYWVDVWSYADGDPPSFFFSEMLYPDQSGNDLRIHCPITCTMDSASAPNFDKKPVTGIEGQSGIYEFAVKDVATIRTNYE